MWTTPGGQGRLQERLLAPLVDGSILEVAFWFPIDERLVSSGQRDTTGNDGEIPVYCQPSLERRNQLVFLLDFTSFWTINNHQSINNSINKSISLTSFIPPSCPGRHRVPVFPPVRPSPCSVDVSDRAVKQALVLIPPSQSSLSTPPALRLVSASLLEEQQSEGGGGCWWAAEQLTKIRSPHKVCTVGTSPHCAVTSASVCRKDGGLQGTWWRWRLGASHR